MIAHNVATLLRKNVTLDLEGIDRMYLNAYQPLLQMPGGVIKFFREQRGMPIVGSSLMAPMTRRFVKAIEQFAPRHGIDLRTFDKGQRKEDLAKDYRRRFTGTEGVLFIGKAQEKTTTFRTARKVNEQTGGTYPWLYRSTVLCNQYYFYLLDADFGPMFIKFSSYFPYTARVCLNGHEYAKRQLDKEGIAYEALDNGFYSCDDPQRLQEILNQLDEAAIEGVFRKWLARLPHPFSPSDRAAGYRYDLSMLQMEFSRTQVFDKPVQGRHFFEQIIRENLDLGRPDNVSLIFARRITKRTPGSFRTRVITQGVIPSLYISYKFTKIKQYFKEGRALRTETTINNSRDFGIGKRLINLPALREIGFAANRRLLNVQQVSHDCRVGEERLARVMRPVEVDGQRGSALRFGDLRAMALFSALCLFSHIGRGFTNKDLRGKLADLLGQDPQFYGPGRMSYDLRRLRLHGLIERTSGRNRYQVTRDGLRISLLMTKVDVRVLRPGCSDPLDGNVYRHPRAVATALRQIDTAVDGLLRTARIPLEANLTQN